MEAGCRGTGMEAGRCSTGMPARNPRVPNCGTRMRRDHGRALAGHARTFASQARASRDTAHHGIGMRSRCQAPDTVQRRVVVTQPMACRMETFQVRAETIWRAVPAVPVVVVAPSGIAAKDEEHRLAVDDRGRNIADIDDAVAAIIAGN